MVLCVQEQRRWGWGPKASLPPAPGEARVAVRQCSVLPPTLVRHLVHSSRHSQLPDERGLAGVRAAREDQGGDAGAGRGTAVRLEVVALHREAGPHRRGA